jgi:hypothetical protein
MSKDMKRKRKLKKDLLEKDFFNKFCSLELFSEDKAPPNIAVAFKKAYKKMLVELSDKKDKTSNEKTILEFLKMIRLSNFDPKFSPDSYTTIKILEKQFIQKLLIEFKTDYKFDTRKFLFTMLQLTTSCITSYLLKNSNFKNFFPYYFFTLGFLNNQVYIKFLKIESLKTDNGTLFKHLKGMNVEGEKYEIYFTKHSLDRISERILSEEEKKSFNLSFLNAEVDHIKMDALSEFFSHTHFNFCGFSGNQHLLCCYMPLTYDTDDKIKSSILKSIEFPLLKNQRYDKILMRYFYFPFEVVGKKIICKSSLLAGFQGTPEFSLKNKILSDRIEFKDICSDDSWKNFKDILRSFYDKYENNSYLFNNDFSTIVIMYHLLGKEQFFKGEWIQFPTFSTLRKQIITM